MMDPRDMNKDIDHILISEEALHSRIREMGAQISREYDGKRPLLVGVLKGVVPFYAAMAQAITIPVQEDFMCVSSYESTHSTGSVKFRKDLDVDIKDRHVIILEDILDSGRTLAAVKENLLQRGPASVKICTLLDKPEGRVVPLEADYTCFAVPNEFVVGFGLDYNEYYRNLPYVGVLKPEIYQNA